MEASDEAGEAKKSNKEQPVYKRIAHEMRSRIESGEWPVGTLLPSRPKLAKEYGVALVTLERAIDQLREMGVVRTVNGQGTFVAHPHVSAASSSLAVTPSSLSIQILSTTQQRLSQGHIHAHHEMPLIGILGDIPTSMDLVYRPDPHTFGYDWMGLILRSFSKALSMNGAASTFLHRHGLPGYSIGEAISSLMNRGAQAIVIANVLNNQVVTQEVLATIDPLTIPVVLLPWFHYDGPLAYVMYDQVYAGYRAAQHLLQVGYQPLVFLNAWGWDWCRERLRGAQSAVRDVQSSDVELSIYGGIVPMKQAREDNLGEDPIAEDFGKEAARQLLASSHPLSAATDRESVPGIIALNDLMAQGFLQEAERMGMQMGVDFGLIGFDDIPIAGRLGLTTLAPPLEEMGQEAASLLLTMLQGRHTTQQVLLRSHLVIRDSTIRLRDKRSQTIISS